MLHTKIQGHKSVGLQKKILNTFTFHGHGGHVRQPENVFVSFTSGGSI